MELELKQTTCQTWVLGAELSLPARLGVCESCRRGTVPHIRSKGRKRGLAWLRAEAGAETVRGGRSLLKLVTLVDQRRTRWPVARTRAAPALRPCAPPGA